MIQRLKATTYSYNWAVLATLGLSLLLLLAPCKVRNAVQAELGWPPTEVLNKSKSATSASCQTASRSSSLATVNLPKLQALQDGVLPRLEYLLQAPLRYWVVPKARFTLPRVACLPRYLLYRRILLYA